jgi:hypothetical protein
MRPVALAALVLLAVGAPSAQAPSLDRALVGTWTLVATEEAVDTPEASRVANPRGLLVLDAAGWTFEGITRDNRQRPTPAQAVLTEAQLVFATWGGSWGRYSADAGSKQLTLRPEGSFSPSVMGREFVRSYAVTGDRLVVTSRPGEPHARGATRWTWEKVPPVENLSPGYRQVVGFWRHEIESRVNLTLKTEVSTRRAPSVVVYTPAGYVGVHFPALNRKPFTSDPPGDAEAKEALRGYVGYFGALGVYPGQVFHQILGGTVSAGTTLKRFFDLAPGGDTVNLRFPVARNAQGQETTTLVTMKRLSGVSDFLIDPPTR